MSESILYSLAEVVPGVTSYHQTLEAGESKGEAVGNGIYQGLFPVSHAMDRDYDAPIVGIAVDLLTDLGIIGISSVFGPFVIAAALVAIPIKHRIAQGVMDAIR
jgi:hypothetical protein